MSVIENGGAFNSRVESGSRLRVSARALIATILAAAAVALLAYLYVVIHPAAAVWAGFVMLAWLFIAGAAIASGDR